MVAIKRSILIIIVVALAIAFVAVAAAPSAETMSATTTKRAAPSAVAGLADAQSANAPEVAFIAGVIRAQVAAYLEALYQQDQAVQAYLEALYRASLPRTTMVYASSSAAPPGQTGAINVDWALWQRLHVCEQSNTWYANGGNSGDSYHQTFQGGLGMSTVAWQMAVRAAAARGVSLPGSALDASPEQQMTGAQAFFDAYGWAWACHV